ncbi:cyclic pyranopterin monophosphate synthase subunit MoaC [Humidesulfovibrio mexicanus]|jgi:cyclic pyranopterin phosphate synthase|uniref:Cyclic pyranopterin monophosphate synthase n=1 Tax=Humidesulfovibrio mexicanus TaxID=147047 RepID=A0A238XS83_9BACT|nr:cyclic pyranopterin monophosphate synthase MoaC [Humidesulfovibrio mexicanus]SNR61562.1 cyclic pyranopterin monophosphate synthase subunit MoaC [Humidesulfovibrio mexicanus]
MSQEFSHIDDTGRARMVDVSGKSESVRIARVRAEVVLNERTMRLLVDKALPKGEVLGTARVAGILAAKRTAELIPLCHPLPLDFADVSFELDEAANIVRIEAEARTSAKTGVEMEALLAAQVAAATIYDMCKAVQKDIRITDCRLVYKSGGKSGLFQAD